MDVLSSVWLVPLVPIVLLVTTLFAFRIYSRETVFEKAYGVNALRLLAENRSNKAKNGKNRSKPRALEKKKEVQTSKKDATEKLDRLSVALETQDNGANAQNLSDVEQTNAAVVKTSKKKTGSEKFAPSQFNEVEVQNVEVAQKFTATTLEATKNETAEQNRPTVNSAVAHQKPKEDKDKSNIQMKTELVADDTAINSARSLNLAKAKALKGVLLSKIPNARNEMLNSSHQNEAQNCEQLLNSLKEQVNEKSVDLARLKNVLKDSEEKDREITRLRSAHAETKKKCDAFEKALRDQVQTSTQNRLQWENNRNELQMKLSECGKELKKVQNELHARPPVKQVSDYQQKIQSYITEITATKSFASRLQAENKQQAMALQKAKKSLLDRNHEVESLMKSNALLEKRLLDTVKNEEIEREALENKLKTMEQTIERLGYAVGNVRREIVQRQENEQLIANKDKLLLDKQDELSKLANENSVLLKRIENINTEISSLWCCRDELSEFRKIYKQKLIDIEQFEKDLAICKSDLEKSLKENAEMQEKIERQANIELMKEETTKDDKAIEAKMDDNAPKGEIDAEFINEIENLKKEIEYLRETNYKIVELSQKQEKIFKQTLENALKGRDGSKDRCERSDACEALRQKYGLVLTNLSTVIDAIETKMLQQEGVYESKIFELKKRLKRTDH